MAFGRCHAENGIHSCKNEEKENESSTSESNPRTGDSRRAGGRQDWTRLFAAFGRRRRGYGGDSGPHGGKDLQTADFPG